MTTASANATVTIKLTVDQAEFIRNVLNRYIAQMTADARALPGLDVWSRVLMGHPYRVIRRMRYGPGSTWERHDD
jgi:hypothetical protein